MPRVWNKRDPNCPKDAVYVGRPSKWGNPLKIGQGNPPMTREQVLDYYKNHYLPASGLYLQVGELRGRDLVCWCAPKPCHADVLLELANEEK